MGTKARRTPQYKCIMCSEVDTMNHIKAIIPHFPIPEVLGTDLEFDNEIGAPYIILSFTQGICAERLWYEPTEDGEFDPEMEGRPSEAREHLRIAFLRSLEKTMAELRYLEFGDISMLVYEEKASKIVIGTHYGYRMWRGVRKDWQLPVYHTAAEH